MNEDPCIQRQKCFEVPYCPNEKCRFHFLERAPELKPKRQFYLSKGWMKRHSYPFMIKRYRCLECKTTFSYTSFKLEYRQVKWGLNSKIFSLFTVGASNREISRRLGCSEPLVRRRLKRLAEWVFIKQTELLGNHLIEEPLVYDGLEAFAKSQYDPNHIQQVLGKESLFIYDFNFCPLNRKGRMSPRQKNIRDFQYETIGKYPPRAIRTSSCEIFKRVYEKRKKKNAPIILYSDEHFQYRRAIQNDLKDCHFEHVTISSKDYRNYKNHLFAVNHSDLLIRQHVAAFKRETISFSKKHEKMIQKFALFMCWKNFMRPQYVKEQKRNKKSNIQSPAMALSITKKILKFHEFFNIKRTLKQVSLNREWECFYREIPTYTRELKQVA